MHSSEIKDLFGDISSSDDDSETAWKRRPKRTAHVPKPGTTVQRSDAVQRRKALILTTPPPPPPRTNRRTSDIARLRRRLQEQLQRRPVGPSADPTTRVTPRPPSARPTTTPTPEPRAAPRVVGIATVAGRVRVVPPPPPAKAPPPVAPSGQTRATPPTQAPPVRIKLEEGTEVDVPFHAAYISRKYKVRTASGRWIIRFDPRGQPRAIRRLPP